MTAAAILAPVFVLVLLKFVLIFATGRKRIAAVRAGEVKIRDIALGQRVWPAQVTQVSNALDNQFQLPVLFYLLVAFAMITNKADLVHVVLSWLFVISRLGHAWVHTTSNHISHRFRAFAAGVFILMAMWIVFALQLVDLL